VLASVTLIVLDDRLGALGPARSAVATALGPVQRSWGGVVGSDSALRRDNARLAEQLSAARLDAATAGELRRLRLSAGTNRIIAGRVVAISARAGVEWSVTIGLGTRDGVRPRLTVIAADGLVGRVTRAFARTSLVLLAIDPSSAVGARLAGGGEIGLCRGAGRRPMALELLDPRAAVAVGDEVRTGPAGATTYVPGIAIGRVSRVSRASDGLVRAVEVQPAVGFTALDLVGVVVPAT